MTLVKGCFFDLPEKWRQLSCVQKEDWWKFPNDRVALRGHFSHLILTI